MLKDLTFSSIAVALGSGIAIGIQSTFFTLIGRSLGPVRASLVANVAAGLVAGLIILGIMGIQGNKDWALTPQTLLFTVIAVTLGIFIVTGIAFSFQFTGVALGSATVFLGQMIIGTIIDAWGLTGSAPIPLDWRRLLGLALIAIALILLGYQK